VSDPPADPGPCPQGRFGVAHVPAACDWNHARIGRQSRGDNAVVRRVNVLHNADGNAVDIIRHCR